MKVLIVNTYESGGAAKASFRLTEGLKANNIEVSILLQRNNDDRIKAETLKPCKTPFFKYLNHKIKRLLVKLNLKKKDFLLTLEDKFLQERSQGLELFSFPDSTYDITSSTLYKEADIINFHWVANFLDYSSFFKKNKKPLVWTLHDMNPFSGGEHYEEVYYGIDDNGFPKKRLLTQLEQTMFSEVNRIKKEALVYADKLSIVSPSQWLADKAKESYVFKDFPIYTIPNSLNTSIYKLIDQKEARLQLDIPLDKRVILFVAESLASNRKGFSFLKRALEELNDDGVVLCAVGKNNIDLDFKNYIELGRITDETKMSMVYAAADVFVIPSLMDNLPNTVLESLLCGTPVIGFPVGGIPEMITNKKNGLITKVISVNALVESIKEFLSNSQDYNRAEIQKEAFKIYNLDVQAKAYIKLFNSILEHED